MCETWKPVMGYEGLYEVSNLGEVRGLTRRKPKLRGQTNNRGYRVVFLNKDKTQKCHLVHRLVALAFVKKPVSCDVVNHIDNNPLNNKAENLEWVTQKDNVHHAAAIGASIIRPVVRSDGKTEFCYPSVSATQADGFSKSCVCQCCQGKLKKYRGYTWRYV